jgi:prepilin signal peptidase PulO-like enzyme (type II secretory pathway)
MVSGQYHLIIELVGAGLIKLIRAITRFLNCSANEVVSPLEDAVVNEVTLVLREWGHIWKKLYLVSEWL